MCKAKKLERRRGVQIIYGEGLYRFMRQDQAKFEITGNLSDEFRFFEDIPSYAVLNIVPLGPYEHRALLARVEI